MTGTKQVHLDCCSVNSDFAFESSVFVVHHQNPSDMFSMSSCAYCCWMPFTSDSRIEILLALAFLSMHAQVWPHGVRFDDNPRYAKHTVKSKNI